MSRRLKVGIVGFGYMGEIRKQVVERNPCMELIGICDTNPAIKEKVKGCRVYSSFDKFIKQHIDAVFVCTPNAFSPEICIKSMNQGKHVFCEKPPGRNKKDIENIIRAEKRNIKLMFGFNHRFHPGILMAKTIIDNKRLGKIIGMRGVYGKSGGLNFPKSWRNDIKIAGGGILLDQGIHMLDLFLYLGGDFQYVKCFLDNTFWKFNIEDNAYVILKNKSGISAMLHSSATLWKHTFKMDIILEHGYLVIDGLLSKTGSYGREKLILGKRQFEDEAAALGNPSEEVTYFDRDNSWDLEVEEFLNCILQNKKVTISSSQDAIKVMEIIEKAYKDAEFKLMRE
jgi:predicted dehydrogenase